jgi:hypothetical protein
VKGIFVSDIKAKLNLLYKKVTVLQGIGFEFYFVSGADENGYIDNRFIMEDKDGNVVMSVSFVKFEFKSAVNDRDCAFLTYADYGGRRQNIVVLITKLGFKYVNLDDNYVLTGFRMRQRNLCELAYLEARSQDIKNYYHLVFIYDKLCENIRLYVKNKRYYDLFGKWCAICSIESKDYLIYFKDKDNIIETQPIGQILPIVMQIENFVTIESLDYIPFYCLVKGTSEVAEHVVLFNVSGNVEEKFLCWKISSLVANGKITGVFRAYLLNDWLEKTDKHSDIMLVDNVDALAKNTFEICNDDEFAGSEECVVYNTNWSISQKMLFDMSLGRAMNE